MGRVAYMKPKYARIVGYGIADDYKELQKHLAVRGSDFSKWLRNVMRAQIRQYNKDKRGY